MTDVIEGAEWHPPDRLGAVSLEEADREGFVLSRIETAEPPGTCVTWLEIVPGEETPLGDYGTVRNCDRLGGGWWAQYGPDTGLRASGRITEQGCDPPHEALTIVADDRQFRLSLPAEGRPGMTLVGFRAEGLSEVSQCEPLGGPHPQDCDCATRPAEFIDAREFQEAGFLQEANREWFHPRGLAIAVDLWAPGAPEDQPHRRDAVHAALTGALSELGDIYSENEVGRLVAAIEPLVDLSDDRIAGVYDDRADPEGWIFAMPAMLPDGTDVLHTARARAAAVRAEYDRHVDAREAMFGHPIQSVEQIVGAEP